jgi:hypothetical protein
MSNVNCVDPHHLTTVYRPKVIQYMGIESSHFDVSLLSIDASRDGADVVGDKGQDNQ